MENPIVYAQSPEAIQPTHQLKIVTRTGDMSNPNPVEKQAGSGRAGGTKEGPIWESMLFLPNNYCYNQIEIPNSPSWDDSSSDSSGPQTPDTVIDNEDLSRLISKDHVIGVLDFESSHHISIALENIYSDMESDFDALCVEITAFSGLLFADDSDDTIA